MSRIPVPPSVHATLTKISRGTGPIVVGPWLSEVGYELLYWIPFVAWAQAQYGWDPDRLVVVSRGGCQAWYAHITRRYLDLLSWVTPDAFRAANAERVRTAARRTEKQFTVGPFDHAMLAHVQAHLGVKPAVLHPSLMYGMFRLCRPWRPEWQRFARHQPFRPVQPLPGLPARYVAVRCYTSSICPDTAETRGQLADLLRELLQDSDVVLLHTGVQCDDHAEYRFPSATGRLHQIDGLMTPATNLDIQTRAIAGASRFVGTYGGFAYLAPLLGVAADTVYVSTKALRKLGHHLTVAQRLFASDPRYGALTVASLHAPREAYVYA